MRNCPHADPLPQVHRRRREQIPLPEKLRRIFMLRVKEAKTDEDRARAQLDLDRMTAVSNPQNETGAQD